MDSRLIIDEITAQLDAVMATDAAWIRQRLAVAGRVVPVTSWQGP